jgi:(1->4)-alpha-D-glucan 1-alpha-D-glucosylmutase
MPDAPSCTYRLQFHPGFTFDHAAAVVDYLADLGVSHLYASPYLQAAPGSRHGYDVVDHGRVNAELGGADGHRRLLAALYARGVGQVLDIVPNHMGIAGASNTWWWDVLESGPSSPFAGHFDVQWDPPEERLLNKVLLAVLGDHYGRVLERGEIRLVFDGCAFRVVYFDHCFPASPHSIAGLLRRTAERSGSETAAFYADIFQSLLPPVAADPDTLGQRSRDKRMLFELLCRALAEDPQTAAGLRDTVAEVNGSADLLDAFLEQQNYRLAYWRTAARDLGYRRFFDITSLVGLLAEDERVFAGTHELVLSWVRTGEADGLRVDHPDGLLDPRQYLERLRAAAPEAWIVVEKILHPDEALPGNWPVAGTTGYDFLNLAGGLFCDPAGEPALSELHASLTGGTEPFEAVARAKKHLVLHELLGSDVNRLAELVVRICERHRRFRDFTRYEINEALRELVACTPVYRTYVQPETGVVSEPDRQVITRTVEAAKGHRKDIDPGLIEFLASLLTLDRRGEMETEFVCRFQQLTGPAAAKGVEDTAFYTYVRLAALNEVGGDPGRFGTSPDDFHRDMQGRAEHAPLAMLASSTHDTKRSEDVRARLMLLSEIPGAWAEAVHRWSSANRRHLSGDAPGPVMEYLLYQTLVGTWPIEPERVLAYMEKAAREAKLQTSWVRPDAEYESRLAGFVRAVLDDRGFCDDLAAFTEPLVKPGFVNSLAFTLLKLAAPGVPDIYQGCETWDFSLVDPDNRRPVDFERRRRLLGEIRGMTPEQAMHRVDEGAPKLHLIASGLRLRREAPDLRSGGYSPLAATGERAAHVLGFLRGESVAAVVPRLVLGLGGRWADTRIRLNPGAWRNVLTEENHAGGEITVSDLLRRFPVALLHREDHR